MDSVHTTTHTLGSQKLKSLCMYVAVRIQPTWHAYTMKHNV